MLDEDVPQDGELGFLRRHFALLRLERRAEALQRRGGIELVDLPFDLVGNKFSLQVYAVLPPWLALRFSVEERPSAISPGSGGKTPTMLLFSGQRIARRQRCTSAVCANGQRNNSAAIGQSFLGGCHGANLARQNNEAFLKIRKNKGRTKKGRKRKILDRSLVGSNDDSSPRSVRSEEPQLNSGGVASKA